MMNINSGRHPPLYFRFLSYRSDRNNPAARFVKRIRVLCSLLVTFSMIVSMVPVSFAASNASASHIIAPDSMEHAGGNCTHAATYDGESATEYDYTPAKLTER